MQGRREGLYPETVARPEKIMTDSWRSGIAAIVISSSDDEVSDRCGDVVDVDPETNVRPERNSIRKPMRGRRG
jgi:hypothetical protein